MLRRIGLALAATTALACGVSGALLAGGASGGGGIYVTVYNGTPDTLTIEGTSGFNTPDVYRDGPGISVSPATDLTGDACSQSGSTVTCPLTGLRTVSAALGDDDDEIVIRGDLTKLHFVVSGQGGGDALTGGRGDDRLRGGSGADNLKGRGGDDILAGGADNDELNGGPGTDRCRVGGGINATLRCEKPRGS